jgi:predicted alpha/beta superfamily hydrolase
MTLRLATLTVVAVVACGPTPPAGDDGDDGSPDPDAAPPPSIDAPDGETCPPGPAGAACVIALADDALATCDPAALDRVAAELAARRGWLPLWHAGRALFAADAAAEVAGSFADWAPLALAPACDRTLHVALVDVPTGRHEYKLIAGGVWRLDPWNLAFAYDDFAGNADGRNSVLATPDAGVGQLVAFPEPLCSAELGNCRAVTAYLPRGYTDPANAARRYPVVYMHDGQNVFDDHDCCFGHTGWEVNVAIDAGVAAGTLAEVIVVAAEHAGARRNAEYGWTLAAGGAMETFMAFQVGAVQPAAEALLRIDPARRAVAGSSLGGLVSMRLALAYPEVYAGAAALSGAFWPGEDTGTALADALAAAGKQPVGLYLDHGGTAASGADGYAGSIAIRDQLVGLGWQRADSPACSVGPDALCYHHEPGATHDELAWRDRAWRFLAFLAGT